LYAHTAPLLPSWDATTTTTDADVTFPNRFTSRLASVYVYPTSVRVDEEEKECQEKTSRPIANVQRNKRKHDE
jgi:hypothetical protein